MRNRSQLRRFPDSGFAQFAIIYFSGSEQRAHDGAAFEVRSIILDNLRGPDMGTDSMFDVWADSGANRGTDTIFGPSRRIFDTRSEIWGQTRCPVRRSGTFNVKRSTLNF